MRSAILISTLLLAPLALANVVDPSHSVQPVVPEVGQPVVHGGHQPVVEHSVGHEHVGHDHVGHEHVGHEHVHHPQPLSVPSFYAPSGFVQTEPARAAPQSYFGQPEPTSLPANYKPWGSWGLYIGGNQPDGYYTEYYKSLTDKPASAEPVKPVAEPAGATSALGSLVRQAGSNPFAGGEFYSLSELNSAHPASPVHTGASLYGTPASFASNHGSLSYADSYSSKKIGSSYGLQREVKGVEAPVSSVKSQSYQPRVYVYPPAVSNVGHLSAPGVVGQHATVQTVPIQHQLVAYPVPVASQIVGSQPGSDGLYYPYGVHGYTRYAVRPAVVSSQDQTYYSSIYRQSPATTKSQQAVSTQYAYPLGQVTYGPVEVAAPVQAPQTSSQSQSVQQPAAAPASQTSQTSTSQVESSEKASETKQQEEAGKQ